MLIFSLVADRFSSAASAKVTVVSAGKGRTTASPSHSSIPDVVPIPGEGEWADQGGSSFGDVDPDSVGESLVSEEDVVKLKELFHRVYAFTTVSYLFLTIWALFSVADCNISDFSRMLNSRKMRI